MTRCQTSVFLVLLIPLPGLAADSLVLSQRSLLLEDSRLMRDLAIERMQQIRFAFREKPADDGQWSNWSRAFGGYGSWDADRAAPRMERRAGGLLVGADRPLAGMWMAGALAGVSRSELHADGGATSDVDSYHLGAYATTRYYQLGFKMGASLAWHDLHESGHAASGQVFAEAAYPQDFRDFTLEPYAGLAYVQQRASSTRERGLDIGADSEGGAYMTLGWRAASTWQVSEKRLVGRVGGAVRHGFVDARAQATGWSAQGEAVELEGRVFSRDVLRLDLSLDYELSRDLSVGVSYAGQYADDARDNLLGGRLSLKF